MSSTEEKSMIKEGIKYGAIIAVVNFAIYLLMYVVDYTMLFSGWSTLFLLVAIGLHVYYGIKFRKETGGYLKYGRALGFLLIISATLVVISLLFNLLMYNVIDPQLPEMIKEGQIDMQVSILEAFNTPDEKIDAAITEIEKQDFGSFSILIQGMIYGFLIYALIDLILALFVKRSRPDFE